MQSIKVDVASQCKFYTTLSHFYQSLSFILKIEKKMIYENINDCSVNLISDVDIMKTFHIVFDDCWID